MADLKKSKEYLDWLEKDVKQFEKTKKYYRIQSEFYGQMYRKLVELETLRNVLKK